MINESDINSAIAELNSQLKPNISAIARKWNIERTTLAKRYSGQTASRATYLSEQRQCLTNEQEDQLIIQINRLTERGMPPTSQIVKNLAEEVIGRSVRKNWTANFVRRHQGELYSLYLRNINNLRVKGEYIPTYKLFFDLVSSALSGGVDIYTSILS
jgi:Tc5 transposase DNA-binding domain